MSTLHAAGAGPVPTRTAATRTPLRRSRVKIGTWIATLLVLAWVVISVLPVFSILLGSLKTTEQIASDPLGIPSPFVWGNFAEGWAGVAVGNAMSTYLWNTTLFTVASVAVSIGAGTAAAYVLARRRGKLSSVFEKYFVLLYALPFLAYIIPLFSITGTLGIRSNPAAIGVVFAASWLPLTVTLMFAFFSGVPMDIIEAAKLDGASEWKIFRSIVAPVARSAILSNVLLAFIYAWNNLSHTLPLLVVPDTRTVAPGLLLFTQQYSVNVGAQLAGLFISIAPLIVAYLLLHKHIMESFRVGSFR